MEKEEVPKNMWGCSCQAVRKHVWCLVEELLRHWKGVWFMHDHQQNSGWGRWITWETSCSCREMFGIMHVSVFLKQRKSPVVNFQWSSPSLWIEKLVHWLMLCIIEVPGFVKIINKICQKMQEFKVYSVQALYIKWFFLMFLEYFISPCWLTVISFFWCPLPGDESVSTGGIWPDEARVQRHQ